MAMEENTDLRILEKRLKTFKSLTVLFGVLTPLPLLGVGLKHPYQYIFVALCVLFFITALVSSFLCRSYTKKAETTVNFLKGVRDKTVAANDFMNTYLSILYTNVNADECKELNQVAFANEEIVFSAQGKFAIKKDFNGVKGNHLALQVCGTELISAPEGYDDVLDYESNLFKLNIGYFEDSPFTEEIRKCLTLPEEDFINKKLTFSAAKGYSCDLDTAESDEIDFGELTVLEYTQDSLTIFFKCLVLEWVSDVVFGKVKLSLDAQVSE